MVTKGASNEKWILDSGCTYHICPNKAWFEDFEPMNGGTVLLGNNEPCKMKGIGSIRLPLPSGIEILLSQVRYIPTIKHNLISVGVLDD